MSILSSVTQRSTVYINLGLVMIIRNFVIFMAGCVSVFETKRLSALAGSRRKNEEEDEFALKRARMEEKIEAYKKAEFSESKDMCKQCEFIVSRLSTHLLAAAEDGEQVADRNEWLKRLPRYCEPMNTPACAKFLKLFSGLIADDLADLSEDASELGQNEPSLQNVPLRARICDDVTETCQNHHKLIRSDTVVLIIRNALRKKKAKVFWLRQNIDDEVNHWEAVIPAAMTTDHLILPNNHVKIEARRGQQFVILPDNCTETSAPRLLVRKDGPNEQIFELRESAASSNDLLPGVNTSNPLAFELAYLPDIKVTLSPRKQHAAAEAKRAAGEL